LQQCSNFLEGLKIERQPVFDTAGSVMSLLENDTKEIAAIAGEHFENDKRFTILQNNISNHIENYTRFFLVGKEDPEMSETKDKRSAVLIADDKPGSLLQGLKIFEELKFFDDHQVDAYYPLILALLNTPSILFELFPFIFLIFFVCIYNSITFVIVSKYSSKATTLGFSFYHLLPITLFSAIIFLFDPILVSLREIILVFIGGSLLLTLI